MAIELIKRPLGHKISITPVSVTIVDNGAGDAVVYVPGGHSLSDGGYVYIDSNFDSYNGYKYVDATAYDYFKIKNSENGAYISYVQDSEATIYISLVNHGWQGVHTPIAYELHSDISPVNEAEEEYNPNVVDSFQAYGGNTQLNLDHALSDPVALTWIELVGTGDLAGRYQLLTVLQPWSVVINLAYDATYDFSGYTIVKHYNNYHINVGVHAGLESGHRWESKKPFELAGTLNLIPDASGNVKFSIHEILRGYIEIRNNLTLDTLPNNLDFHVSFYITYSESYDSSNGSVVSTFTGEETEDTFIGHAVNAMMPFKSLSESFMSDYISGGDEPARWLTLQDRPVAVVGYFFDVSFLNQFSGADIIVLRNGELFQTITNPGSGVIRVMFIPESGFTEYCLQASIGPLLQPTLPALSTFIQDSSGTDSWSLGANPSYSSTGNSQSDILYAPFPLNAGFTYEFGYDFDVTIGGAQVGDKIQFGVYDDGQLVDFVTIDITSSGNKTGTIEVTPNGSNVFFGVRVIGTPSTINLDINSLESAIIDIGSKTITEQLCIDIIEECGSTLNNPLRITDGSQLRIV